MKPIVGVMPLWDEKKIVSGCFPDIWTECRKREEFR